MNITHHLDPATIVAYASGTLSEALAVVAASHIAWCPVCRHAAREAEMIGGEMFMGLEPAEVTGNCRSATLGLIGRATLHRFRKPPAARGEVPAPLARLMGGKSVAELPWKTRAPGVAMIDLPVVRHDRGKLVLMRIAPGRALPEHGHGGEELTLILAGSYTDRFGRFATGDVADLDEDAEHKPVVDDSGPCTCLVATEAPTRFRSISARILQPLIGI